MSTGFGIPLPSSKFVSPDGMISRDWYLFLSALLQSVGGPSVVNIITPSAGGSTPGGVPTTIELQTLIEDTPPSSLEALAALQAIDELRNTQQIGIDPRINDLMLMIDELRNNLDSALTSNQALRLRIETLEAQTLI